MGKFIRTASSYFDCRIYRLFHAQFNLALECNSTYQSVEEVPKSNPMNTISISRRKFAQLLGAGAACFVARPALSFAAEPEAPESASAGIVRLSANENPYGPSPNALKAMSDAFPLSCRYPDEHMDELIDSLAKLNDVNRNQILLGDGSGEILKLCAEAFTGPKRGTMVAADPTFEAILNHAQTNGAKVAKVPLTNNFAHDLPKMAAAAKDGLVYICNPNNPTASITRKDELREFIAKTPRQTMILVDEAYFHYADSSDYESVIPMIKDHANLIVARTFSKIYGMAGLRCGYCIAQRETIEQMRSHQPWDSVNIMAITAALANLNDPDQVENGRRLNSEAKIFVTGELNTMGYQSIPSQANFIMVGVKRPVVPLIQAMKQRNVQVGRLFPALPNHMRVTIGKKSEMETFLSAFRQVTA
jgi:histidinol-phosphate aminotransferase